MQGGMGLSMSLSKLADARGAFVIRRQKAWRHWVLCLLSARLAAFQGRITTSLQQAPPGTSNMEGENLKTASAYVNNLLLARGLLRNGEPIDFHRASASDGSKGGPLANIINLVHDLVLRRDVSARTWRPSDTDPVPSARPSRSTMCRRR